MDLATAGVGRVIERLVAGLGWPEADVDHAAPPEAGDERRAPEAAVALRLEAEDRSTHEVAEQVVAVVLARPRAPRHEGSTRDRSAPVVVAVVEDRVRH